MKKTKTIFTSAFIMFVIVHSTLNIDNCKAQWFQQSVPQNYGLLLSMDFIDSSKLVSCGWYNFNGRVLYTIDGGTNWLPSAVPDSSRSLVTVKMIDSLSGYIAGAYNTFAFSEPFPSSYNNFRKIGFSSSMIRHMENIGLSNGINYKGLFLKTTDGGRNWFTFGTFPSEINYLIGMDFIDANTGVVTTSIQDSAYNFNSTILKTTNGGFSWTEILNIDTVKELRAVEFIDENNIVAVGYGGSSDSISSNIGGMIFKSTDDGTNWSLKFFPDAEFSDVSFTDDSTGFASAFLLGDGLIYKTTNQGNNWNVVYTLNGNNALIDGIDFHKGSGTGMIYGASNSVFGIVGFTVRTTNYGDTWGSIQNIDSTGINLLTGGTMVSDLKQYISGGYPFGQAAIHHTNNGGLVNIKISDNSIPDKYSLYQNYPNPFNPSTTINYELGITNFVILKVYDVLGNEMASLVDKKQTAGKYSVEFDGSNFASGVYFYSLFADGILMDTKRMLLVK